MRCLHCGKELALLKRLTGSEFCSDAHKQSYQDEYNRLALTRLLQAQSKTDENKGKLGKPTATAKRAGDAGEPRPEWIAEPQQQDTPETMAPLEPAAVNAEPVAPKAQQENELTATEMAGFCDQGRPPILNVDFNSAVDAAVPAEFLLLPSKPSDPVPVMAAEGAMPARAELLTLNLRSAVAKANPPEAAAESVMPQAASKEFSTAALNLNISIQPSVAPRFSTAPMVALQVAAIAKPAPASRHEESIAEFRPVLEFSESLHSALTPTGVEFPPEDADVILSEPVDDAVAPLDTNGSPREALLALAKLHKAIQEENARPELAKQPDPGAPAWQESEQEIDTSELERIYGDGAAEPAYATVQNKPVPDSSVSVVEPTSPEPAVAISRLEIEVEEQPVPVARARVELLPMPMKVFTPAKARIAPGFPALPHNPGLEIPAADALPLRPKIGLNTSHVVKDKVEEKKTSPEPQPPATPEKPTPASKPAGPREERGKGKTPAWTPVIKTTARPLVQRSPAAPEPAQPRQEPAAKESAPAATVAPPSAANPNSSGRETAPPPKPEAALPNPSFEPALSVPSLMMGNSSGSFWGSLPISAKIAMATVAALILAVVIYMASSGGQKKTGGAVSADVAGPSIMMGEGGWVTGWAGDATGLHRGRQITMYRPSLKLSDYRIEFQGRVISNSMGWVFRASDGANYYAMKLTQVSSGYKLQKYSVVNGREHDAGQTALPAPRNGIFNIRIDVRGPRFSTYIQGQPVDIWTENQLKTGGVGFLNDRGDRADIKGVSMSYLTGVTN